MQQPISMVPWFTLLTVLSTSCPKNNKKGAKRAQTSSTTPSWRTCSRGLCHNRTFGSIGVFHHVAAQSHFTLHFSETEAWGGQVILAVEAIVASYAAGHRVRARTMG